MKNVSPLLAALGLSLGAHTCLLSNWDQGHPPKAPPDKARVVQALWVGDAGQQAAAHTRPDAPPSQAKAPAAIPGHDLALAQAGAPQVALPPRAPTASPADAARPLEAVHFWLPHEVDLRALPMQAPDPTPLDGLPWPHEQALRLRLAITAQGEVVDVTSLDDPAPPSALLAALQSVFRATAFMPARRQGQDVASLQDIEITP